MHRKAAIKQPFWSESWRPPLYSAGAFVFVRCGDCATLIQAFQHCRLLLWRSSVLHISWSPKSGPLHVVQELQAISVPYEVHLPFPNGAEFSISNIGAWLGHTNLARERPRPSHWVSIRFQFPLRSVHCFMKMNNSWRILPILRLDFDAFVDGTLRYPGNEYVSSTTGAQNGSKHWADFMSKGEPRYGSF